MSFGVGVGDFIAVGKLINTIRRDFVSAPGQFSDISDELRNLSIVVQDVGIIASAETLRDRQQLELQQITDGCQKVLENLETALNKYHDLSNDNKRIKSAWKRLTWEPEDIRGLRSRICVHVGLLNAFNGRLTRDITAKLIHYQDAQKHQELVHWLSPFDFAAQHADYVSRQQSGTGQWLLNSTEFQTFVTKPSQILFSPGIPGAWKTILTSIIIEELHARFQNEDEVGMAYVYCSYQRKYTLEDLLAILLKQLIQRMQSVPKDFVDLYHCYKRRAGRLSLRELRKWFQCATSLYSKVFIIVDALDECNISFALLPELFALQTLSHVNLFATSRCLPNIATKFGDTPSLEIRASDEDIQTYLKENIPRLLPSFVSRNPNLQEEIIAIILSAAGGVFLLAHLHLNSLIGKRSPKALRTALARLSAGSEAYDDAYTEIMNRIQGQVKDQRELAKQALLWVICSTRPLSPLELQHALAIEIGSSQLDEDNIPDIMDIISVCAGLITVDKQSDVVRLIHYTAQEYFDRTWRKWFPRAHRDITIVTITYLPFNNFETGSCGTWKEYAQRLKQNPLFEYAAANWGHHARADFEGAEELLLKFLNEPSRVSASS